jgi:hypothetical protein
MSIATFVHYSVCPALLASHVRKGRGSHRAWSLVPRYDQDAGGALGRSKRKADVKGRDRQLSFQKGFRGAIRYIPIPDLRTHTHSNTHDPREGNRARRTRVRATGVIGNLEGRNEGS